MLTVFNQSYNCQTSHYLGRNRLPKPFLILPSLGQTDNTFWYFPTFSSSCKVPINEIISVLHGKWGHCIQKSMLFEQDSIQKWFPVRKRLDIIRYGSTYTVCFWILILPRWCRNETTKVGLIWVKNFFKLILVIWNETWKKKMNTFDCIFYIRHGIKELRNFRVSTRV